MPEIQLPSGVSHHFGRVKAAVKHVHLRLWAKLLNFLASNAQHMPGVRMRAGEETRVSLNTITTHREKHGTGRRRGIVETQFVYVKPQANEFNGLRWFYLKVHYGSFRRHAASFHWVGNIQRMCSLNEQRKNMSVLLIEGDGLTFDCCDYFSGLRKMGGPIGVV